MKVTRGNGLLENFLARLRASKANSLIPDHLRQGRILDIGCGSFPYFLDNINFKEKFGIDKSIEEFIIKVFKETKKILLFKIDIEKDGKMPFENEYFDVVTMLAVIEHIAPENLRIIISEVQRILKTNGVFIITTPAKWTDGLLKMMARFHLVSPHEIEDHKNAFTSKDIISLLIYSGFQRNSIHIGYFELFMNIWVAAYK